MSAQYGSLYENNRRAHRVRKNIQSFKRHREGFLKVTACFLENVTLLELQNECVNITHYSKRSISCSLYPTLHLWVLSFSQHAAAVTGVHWEPILFLIGNIRTCVIFNDLIHQISYWVFSSRVFCWSSPN